MTEERTARTCGGCTLCCYTHGVQDDWGAIVTKCFDWCTSCAIGEGCKIYADRPRACGSWSCAWRFGEGEEQDRPDKTQIVLAFKYTSLKMTLYMTAATNDALDSEYAKRITRAYALEGYPIVREDPGGRKELVIAKGFYLREDDRKEAQEAGLEVIFID